ncbi:membrane dipeptidase [Arthrobacter russicus]|uniref:Microsomal dipeptidase-like Zn-dependent dipeptidase n=1 Tax=Arthrobacter russicus TaxID=172040 RepID=A0ABU1JED6_9MICC|nr:membrane dipeptidase [Arthrobacter russicus]MDN5667225.1 dipeptidase [Renibacterium salmoninarum]MDR6270494.1 microsomal dipeptidase-like Zn-dependent dipeptidase [Arthrobacter russicus]
MNLHDRATVVDGLQISNWSRPVLEELRAGGVSAVNATCAVWENAADTLRSIGQWLELANRNPDLVFLAKTGDDIDLAKQQNKVAVFLGFQNASPFEDDYRYVEAFHRLGVRIGQLTYNNQNLLGSGCFEAQDAGLTRYGRVIVTEMNRVGMLIDLSHVGHRTSREAIEESADPVAITHSNPLWFFDSPRNKPDEVIRALVDRGGVIGCCLYPTVSGGEHVTLRSFCEMVRRMAEQYGAAHIGIGSDCTRGWNQEFVGWLRNGRWKPTDPQHAPSWPQWPAWFKGPSDFPQLTEGLSAAGLDDQTITAILGGNWSRLFSEVMDVVKEPANV